MRRSWARVAVFGATTALVLASGLPSADAIHWYRGTGSGCSAADGPLTDDPEGTTQNVTTSVPLGHNVFSRGVAGTGFSGDQFAAETPTRIKAGESITWTWNSSHCHSVTSRDLVEGKALFDSGFHYPTTPPESQQVAPGLFEYPALDDTPTLSYTRTFDTPGTYRYYCVHHVSIGMVGVVIVDAAPTGLV